jgi:hypothetical protein
MSLINVDVNDRHPPSDSRCSRTSVSKKYIPARSFRESGSCSEISGFVCFSKTLWKTDPIHSGAHLKVKQLVISVVTGIFGTFDRHNDTMAMIMKVLKPPILLT